MVVDSTQDNYLNKKMGFFLDFTPAISLLKYTDLVHIGVILWLPRFKQPGWHRINDNPD